MVAVLSWAIIYGLQPSHYGNGLDQMVLKMTSNEIIAFNTRQKQKVIVHDLSIILR